MNSRNKHYLAQRRNEDSNDLDGMNDNAAGHSKGGARGLYARAIAIALVALYWTGFPGTNSRSMNTVDPMNESETCKVVYFYMKFDKIEI